VQTARNEADHRRIGVRSFALKIPLGHSDNDDDDVNKNDDCNKQREILILDDNIHFLF